MKEDYKHEIEQHVRGLVACIGEDPDRAGLLGTPDRIARMCGEIFRGYDDKQKPRITTFQNGIDGMCYEDIICDRGDFHSMCEHHMMPFFGRYFFAYIPHPQGKILGISKVARVVDYCAARLQVQERLASDIVEMLSGALSEETDYSPLAIGIILTGTHLCKTMRGVKKQGEMTSVCLAGAFKQADKRAELMRLYTSIR